jgi:hypothetical protein
MATTTTRLALRKPAGSDNVNVTTDISDSMDKIDTAATFENLSSFPGSPFTGKSVQRSDLAQQPYYYTGFSWVPLTYDYRFIYKTADETVNNSTTLQDDNHLTMSVNANAIYVFELFIIYNSVSTAADFKYTLICPAGATLNWTGYSLDTAAANRTSPLDTKLLTGSGTTSISPTFGTSANAVLMPRGIIRTAGTSGSLTLQWAQNTLTAENTQVLADSYLMMRRVG